MRTLPRILGAATTGYGLAIMVRPALLARPCGLTDTDAGTIAPPVRMLIAAIGARDAAIGAAMLMAPRGDALRSAVAARVLCDASDALVFGAKLPARNRRLRVAAFAMFWAALCAVSERWAR